MPVLDPRKCRRANVSLCRSGPNATTSALGEHQLAKLLNRNCHFEPTAPPRPLTTRLREPYCLTCKTHRLTQEAFLV